MLSTLSKVLNAMIKLKVDGCFGFSQGAAVVSACLQPDVVASVHRHVKRDGAKFGHSFGSLRRLLEHSAPDRARSNTLSERAATGAPSLSFVLLAHATSTAPIRRALNMWMPRCAVATRSAHLIGTLDHFKAESMAAALEYEGGELRMMLYHPARHEMPRDLQTNEVLHHRLFSHLAAGLGAEKSALGQIPLNERSEQALPLAPQPPITRASSALAHLSFSHEARSSPPLRPPRRCEVREPASPTAPLVALPTEYSCARGSTIDLSMRSERGIASYLVRPSPPEALKFRPVSRLSAAGVSRSQQLVRVALDPSIDELPQTILGLLAAPAGDCQRGRVSLPFTP